MSLVQPFKPAAVILAGGKSSRLGPGSKAMAALGGKTLIRHVLERIAPQADKIVISVQQHQEDFSALGLACVADMVQSHRGPLTGLCSGMQVLASEPGVQWLLLCPCDSPFVPLDLAANLYTVASDSGCPVAVARYQGELQPTFSLWNISLFPQIHEMVMVEGRGGLKSMLDGLPFIAVDWEEAPLPPFFNINTPDDLDQAGRLLDAATRPG